MTNIADPDDLRHVVRAAVTAEIVDALLDDPAAALSVAQSLLMVAHQRIVADTLPSEASVQLIHRIAVAHDGVSQALTYLG